MVKDISSEIDIFGETFVKNNKDKCYLIIDNKNYRLMNKFIFSKKGENTITLVLKQDDIKLRGMFCFFNISDMFKNSEDEFYCNFDEDKSDDNFLIDASSLEHLDVSECFDFSFMFYNCKNLKNYDFLKGWDVSKGKNFMYTFTFCSFPDVSFLTNWNMKKALNMSHMFYGCEKLNDINYIGNWSVDKVKTFCRMFGKCRSITDVNALQNWNMSNALDITQMFESCVKLSKMDSLNNWNLNEKCDKKNIIYDCKSLKNIPSIFKNTSDSNCIII